MAEFFQSAYNAVSSLQAEAAILACWGAFALLSAATIVLALASPAFRRSGKRPFCALVNAFAVVTLAFGDVLIVELPRTLKQDVTDGGGTVLKRGTVLSDRALERAAEAGQYVQAQLKSI